MKIVVHLVRAYGQNKSYYISEGDARFPERLPAIHNLLREDVIRVYEQVAKQTT